MAPRSQETPMAGGRWEGRDIVPIVLQTSTNTKSVFCKNLDN